jgi:arylsulfatase
LIASWPKGIRAHGALRHTPGHVIDLAPTILELAGGQWPSGSQTSPIPAPPGKSLVPAFKRDVAALHDSLWWYHDGNRAIRAGDWKLVADHTNAPELYNLRRDRVESQNLAATNPKKVKELEAAWAARAAEFKATATESPKLPAGKAGPRLNVLFFYSDDQRYDTISALAEFDWLAAERNRTSGNN